MKSLQFLKTISCVASLAVAFPSIAAVTQNQHQLNQLAKTAKQWHVYGNPGFGLLTQVGGEFSLANIAFSRTGTPFAATLDKDSGFLISVYTYNNGSWKQLGSSLSTTSGSSFLAVGPNGTPYVVIGSASGFQVKKYDASTAAWIPAGEIILDQGGIDGFTVNQQGTISVLVNSTYPSTNNEEILYQLPVNQHQWIELPAQPISGRFNVFSLAVDSQGVPYVAHIAEHYTKNTSTLSVVKYNNGSWTSVGDSIVNNVYPDDMPRISFDSHDTPYLAYIDSLVNPVKIPTPNTSSLSVRALVNNQWQPVGQNNFIPATAIGFYTFTVSSHGVPYVAYDDISGAISAFSFNGTVWGAVGAPGFAHNPIFPSPSALDIAVNPADNTPYVIFGDAAHDGAATVERYSNPAK